MGPWSVDSSKPNVRNGDTCGLDETYEFDECVEDHGPGAHGAHATFSFVDVHVKTGAAMGLDEIWKRYNA